MIFKTFRVCLLLQMLLSWNSKSNKIGLEQSIFSLAQFWCKDERQNYCKFLSRVKSFPFHCSCASKNVISWFSLLLCFLIFWVCCHIWKNGKYHILMTVKWWILEKIKRKILATSLGSKKVIVVSMWITRRNEFLENSTNDNFSFFFFDKLKKWNKFKENDFEHYCSIDFIIFTVHIK